MDWVESYEDLIKAMQKDRSRFFEAHHYKKAEIAYKYYLQRDTSPEPS